MSETATLTPAETKAPSVTLGFIKVIVQDLETALTFYERAFGLVATQTVDTPEMTEKMLRKPGVETGPMVILYRHKDGRKIEVGNGWGPVGFYVRDVDAAFAHAVSQGAAPHREPWDSGNLRVAFVLDPEGHEIELVSVRR